MKSIVLLMLVFVFSISISDNNKIIIYRAFTDNDINNNIEKINKSKLESIIKNRQGKTLLLNVWATWCVPCREEMQALVKVQKDFSYVEVIGISTDYPDEIESKIIPFLKKQKLNFKNYVNNFKPDTELIDFLNKKWNGALPATFVFDQRGNQVAFLDGKKSYKQFKEALEKNKSLKSPIPN